MLSSILRIFTIAFFIGRIIYWEFTAWQANRAIPKNPSIWWKKMGAYISDFPVAIIIIIQLLGVSILPISQNISYQLIGFVLVVISIGISIKARMDLGTNWVHAGEYQVKKQQTLTTNGIYSIVRNPIYLSFTLSYIGAELVAQSWLFISAFCFFVTSYIQAKSEEKILLAHFGKKYQEYMSHTKMLIPYIL